MQFHTRAGSSIFSQVERPYERSPLFEWLLKHHDEVVISAGGRRIEWTRLCAEFEKSGLTGVGGKQVNAALARKTWQRVRKEKTRIDALRADERAERERRAAENPRRNMPSQFPKGAYDAPLVTTQQAVARLPATTVQQSMQGFQLSTAEGVVVTLVGRVFKTEEATQDYVFKPDGMIMGADGGSRTLNIKQQLNVRGGRPINDSAAKYYPEIGLRLEE